MAPPQAPMRPGRQLLVLAVIFVGLASWAWFGGSGSWQQRLEPKLGLDLIGGTTVTLQARTETGAPPSRSSLETARDIIQLRVDGLGVSEAEVVIEGDENIIVSLPGKSDDRLKEIGESAQLRFRKVLNSTGDTGAVDPSASPSATPSGSGAPSGSPQPSTSPSTTGAPSSPAPSGTTGAAPSPSVSLLPGVAERRADVQKKIGAQLWQAAGQLQQPLDFSQDPASAAQYAVFKDLTPAEVAVLPPAMQFNVPHVTCAKLDKRPVGSILPVDQQAVACDGSQKLLMDVAKVEGTHVSDADAAISVERGGWAVSIQFTGGGQDKWTNLTREAYNNGTDKKQVAVVLDNKVVSAPTIESVIPGDAEITGQFSKREAELLASQLRYGALPLTFESQEARSISATLGSSHLKAGLLAAGVGMLLVVLYSFFYYRLLGSVIFLSLVLSALLVFMALIVLGRQIGFTLTLAGIAGFIVSLGVAADSFVIYFERLKDEIRDGRSPRSAVPRAWVRARRTIISANTITLMAAVILWIFSVGSVKGFAFALGIATFLDLVVVFLFRHPIMTLFARSKAFLSPRVSGLGRVLERAGTDEPATPTRRNRPKEA